MFSLKLDITPTYKALHFIRLALLYIPTDLVSNGSKKLIFKQTYVGTIFMSLVLIAYVISQRLDDGLPAVLLLVQN